MQPDLRPMLATLTDKPFDDPDWLFETKWDGFRAIAVARPGHASLYSRNLIDISRKYPTDLRVALRRSRKRPCSTASSWRSMRRGARVSSCCRMPSARRRVSSIACSICSISTAGICARCRCSSARRRLKAVLPKSPLLLYSAHVVGRGLKAFERAKRAGEEGVMAKLATQPLPLRRAHARLAEGQGEPGAGSGDRRLHRAAPPPQIFRRAGASGARGQRLGVCRARRDRVRRGDACAHFTRSWCRSSPTKSRSRRRCPTWRTRPG